MATIGRLECFMIMLFVVFVKPFEDNALKFVFELIGMCYLNLFAAGVLLTQTKQIKNY